MQVEAVADGVRKTGYTGFSLLSLSCNDYLALPSVGVQIKNKLQDSNVSLSLPSQRVDRFDDDIANIISGTAQADVSTNNLDGYDACNVQLIRPFQAVKCSA